MKIRNVRKKIITGIVTLFAINQLAIPLSDSRDLTFYEPTIKTESKIVKKYKNLPKKLIALDYINISNMIVNINISNMIMNHSKVCSDCKDYAKETFNVYKELIKQNGRKDLDKKIRLAGGFLNYNLNAGHIWLEVKHEGRWINYESTDYTPKLAISEIKEYSKRSLKGKTDLVVDDSKLAEVIQSFNGTSVFYPKPLFLLNGGLIELLYEEYKDHKAHK